MVKHTLIFLILIGTALGEDIYVAQTAQGADNGTNAANAKSLWLAQFSERTGAWEPPR